MDLKDMFIEASIHSKSPLNHESNPDRYIYKGIMIGVDSNGYYLQDMRYRDLLDEVSPKDLKVLKERGFIAGCDYLSYCRNKKRFKYYIKRLERLYELLKNCTDEKVKENINGGIYRYVDSLFLCRAKIHQYEIKYNTKVKFLEIE